MGGRAKEDRAQAAQCTEPMVTKPPAIPIASVLLDIEGTTTPIDFVYKVLFPYARTHVKDYLDSHLSVPSVRTDIAGLLEENAEDVRQGLDSPVLAGPVEHVSLDSLEGYVQWLMERD